MNEKIFISPENLAYVYNKIKKETIKYKGTVGDEAELPITHSIGDAYYIDGSSNKWVVSDGSRWIDFGSGADVDLSNYYNKEEID